uniref:Phenylalanyl-tRNA synthetase n=1 Tax=Globodera rostochiensis TaxID=31243 RepID=A0A914HCZ1_GLORO
MLSTFGKEIRKSFVDFFLSKGHTFVPSSSVIPSWDTNIDFVYAGVQQFTDIIKGGTEAVAPRVVNSQKCLRLGGSHIKDIELVGRDGYHHSFFEMLGNWSFGDYFKRRHVPGLGTDEECRKIWLDIGVPAGRILPFGMKDNFWEMSGVGPCGPCSEIHYDRIGGRDASHLVNTDHPMVVEIWNLVFIQHCKEANGVLRPLSSKYIDCGMGFERLVSVVQQKTSNYDTDLFTPIIHEIQKHTAATHQYQGRFGDYDKDGIDAAYRITSDHMRAVTVALSDGINFSDKNRRKNTRKINELFKRATIYGCEVLGMERMSMNLLVPIIVQQLGETYPEIEKNQHGVVEAVRVEEERLWKQRDEGMRHLKEMFRTQPPISKVFPGKFAFIIVQNYRIELQLVKQMAAHRGLTVDETEYQRLLLLPKPERTSCFNSRAFCLSNVPNINESADCRSAVVRRFPSPALFELDGLQIVPDPDWWNVSERIQTLLSRRLLHENGNPLNLLKRRIVTFFDTHYRNPRGSSPLFTVCEGEPRLVSVFDNFDSLLIPADHPSRRTSDTYYTNRDYCLRAHTSAHQFRLLRQGLDNFLVIGDVYRRDEIDRTHFPCFHQIEGVRLYAAHELYGEQRPDLSRMSSLFEETPVEERSERRQERHTFDTTKSLEAQLKGTLESLCQALFGPNVLMRWTSCFFPFTHPSYELEVFFNGKWLEVLGCGIIEQKLLDSAGAGSKVGWAFGLGLERLAMVLYQIPDIRLFWSKDSGFLSQFADLRPDEVVKYKPFSKQPQLPMDLSFWLPDQKKQIGDSLRADVYDVIRSLGGDLVEQVNLFDQFENKKTGRKSQTYRIVYRSMERPLSKDEVNVIHKAIEKELSEKFGIEIR